MQKRFASLILLGACQMAVGCVRNSSTTPPYEPKNHEVREGSFINLENSEGGIYIEEIAQSEILVSRRNGYGGWGLSSGGSNNMGNGEFLEILSVDADSKTATIRQTEIERRGFFGAFAF